MATVTLTRQQQRQQRTDQYLLIPNVRPSGLEVSPDSRWRDHRLRQQRPELRRQIPPTFPDISARLTQQNRDQARQDARDAPNRDQVFTDRSLRDLQGFRATRLQFKPLHEIQHERMDLHLRTRPRRLPRDNEEDVLPAFWFERMCSSLFARLWDFAADTFGQEDFSDRLMQADWTRQVLRYLPPDFIRCASVVARGDPYRQPKVGPFGYHDHGYEFLFLSRNDRVYLCTAVIYKLLQEHCIDSLLFGARREERSALEAIDRTQDDLTDGYARKYARSDLAKNYCRSGELFTDDFWPEVGRVTMEILNVLLPVINILGRLNRAAQWPLLTEVYQNLHDIVAEAAYLGNGESWSKSCFWVDFPQPGQLWDDKQEHVTDISWEESSHAARDRDAIAHEQSPAMIQWKAARRAAYDAYVTPQGQQRPSEIDWATNHWVMYNPQPRNPIRRTAKVQIALSPFFERSFPAQQAQVNSVVTNTGDQTTKCHKAQVVYYAGDDADKEEQWEDYTLEQHLKAWDDLVNANFVTKFFRRHIPSLTWVGSSLGWLIGNALGMIGMLFVASSVGLLIAGIVFALLQRLPPLASWQDLPSNIPGLSGAPPPVDSDWLDTYIASSGSQGDYESFEDLLSGPGIVIVEGDPQDILDQLGDDVAGVTAIPGANDPEQPESGEPQLAELRNTFRRESTKTKRVSTGDTTTRTETVKDPSVARKLAQKLGLGSLLRSTTTRTHKSTSYLTERRTSRITVKGTPTDENAPKERKTIRRMNTRTRTVQAVNARRTRTETVPNALTTGTRTETALGRVETQVTTVTILPKQQSVNTMPDVPLSRVVEVDDGPQGGQNLYGIDDTVLEESEKSASDQPGGSGRLWDKLFGTSSSKGRLNDAAADDDVQDMADEVVARSNKVPGNDAVPQVSEELARAKDDLETTILEEVEMVPVIDENGDIAVQPKFVVENDALLEMLRYLSDKSGTKYREFFTAFRKEHGDQALKAATIPIRELLDQGLKTAADVELAKQKNAAILAFWPEFKKHLGERESSAGKSSSGNNAEFEGTYKGARSSGSSTSFDDSSSDTKREPDKEAEQNGAVEADADVTGVVLHTDTTADRYLDSDEGKEAKLGAGPWTVSNFFGLDYNCTFSGGQGTCFQTATVYTGTATVSATPTQAVTR